MDDPTRLTSGRGGLFVEYFGTRRLNSTRTNRNQLTETAANSELELVLKLFIFSVGPAVDEYSTVWALSVPAPPRGS